MYPISSHDHRRGRWHARLAASAAAVAGNPGTMRMIAGLDEPTAGWVKVNGRDYRAAAAPMAELGILLEATARHPGQAGRQSPSPFGGPAAAPGEEPGMTGRASAPG